jgi:catechol 2,3-dioxygenase
MMARAKAPVANRQGAMPIRKPVLDPPFNVVRVSHAELAVRDLAAARAFYVGCLGLLVSDASPDALWLRGVEERNHHSIVLRRADAPMALALGFKLASEEDLDRAAFWFARKGLPTEFPELPWQGRTLRTQDALGMPLEFYARMQQSERMLQKYDSYRGARIQRIDHVNCFSPDVQASHDFFNEIGLRTTEYTETDDAEARLWAVWMHRKGNLHDIAFTNGHGPRLHHVGMWVSGPLDIVHACDLMATSGWLANMERGPGRHGIGNAFFLYVRDPDGHRVELFTSDYLTVDPDLEPLRWSLSDPQRQTLWGHPAPKSWFEEGSRFAGVAVREPLIAARPVVAR